MSPDQASLQHGNNSLLSRIPGKEWEALQPDLRPIDLEQRTVLYERHQTLDCAYFPRRGCISLIINFDDGFQADAGLIGSEGMVGAPLIHGARIDVATAVVQARGEALRLPAAAFARAMEQLPAFARLLLRYGEAMRTQALQIAACNVHHGLEARLARCLLTMRERYRTNDLPVTHEMLATLLSAHRPSVSVAAKRLQEAGLIRYAAGQMLIVDQAELEQAACECFGLMRDHTHGLLG